MTTGWRFAAGYRIRVAVAVSDWPNLWPLPRDRAARDHLAGRAGAAGAAGGRRAVRAHRRATWCEIAQPGADTNGRSQWTGRERRAQWPLGHRHLDARSTTRSRGRAGRCPSRRVRWAMARDDDPLTASTWGHCHYHLRRPGLDADARAEARFEATADEFLVEPDGQGQGRRRAVRRAAMEGADPAGGRVTRLLLAGGRVVVDRDVRIPMRDGVELSADVYRPNRPGPVRGDSRAHPLPQGRSAGAAGSRPEPRAGRGRLRVRAGGRAWHRQLARGWRWTSTPRPSSCDGVEVVEWMARQPWCNGNVGSWGKSYGGFSCIQLAARRPPALRAIAPVYATDDRYTDDMHFDGGAVAAFELSNYPIRMIGMNALPARRWRGAGVRPPLARADRRHPAVGAAVADRAARRPVLAQRLAASRLRADRVPGLHRLGLARRLPHRRPAHGRSGCAARGSCWPGRGRTSPPIAACPRRRIRSCAS